MTYLLCSNSVYFFDGKVLISETASDLQKSLDVFANNCILWKLHVNIARTNVLLLLKGPMSKRNFMHDEVTFEH